MAIAVEELEASAVLPLSLVAHQLGVDRRQVCDFVHSGEVQATKMGQQWFIAASQIPKLQELFAGESTESQERRLESIATELVPFISRHPQCTVRDLSELTHRPRRTILGWVQALDQEGLITRERDIHPRDPFRCSLTKKGEDFLLSLVASTEKASDSTGGRRKAG